MWVRIGLGNTYIVTPHYMITKSTLHFVTGNSYKAHEEGYMAARVLKKKKWFPALDFNFKFTWQSLLDPAFCRTCWRRFKEWRDFLRNCSRLRASKVLTRGTRLSHTTFGRGLCEKWGAELIQCCVSRKETRRRLAATCTRIAVLRRESENVLLWDGDFRGSSGFRSSVVALAVTIGLKIV